MDVVQLALTVIAVLMLYSVLNTVTLIIAYWFLTQHYQHKTEVMIGALAEFTEGLYSGKRHED